MSSIYMAANTRINVRTEIRTRVSIRAITYSTFCLFSNFLFRLLSVGLACLHHQYITSYLVECSQSPWRLKLPPPPPPIPLWPCYVRDISSFCHILFPVHHVCIRDFVHCLMHLSVQFISNVE